MVITLVVSKKDSWYVLLEDLLLVVEVMCFKIFPFLVVFSRHSGLLSLEEDFILCDNLSAPLSFPLGLILGSVFMLTEIWK